MKRRILSLLLIVAMVVSLVPAALAADVAALLAPTATEGNDNLLRLWYTKPATDWQTESLAIGNGYMGALVFGGIANDRIHINEKSVWNGGPTETNNYNYGNTNPTETEEDLEKIRGDLEAIRQKLDDKSEYVFGFDENSYTASGTSTSGEAMNWLNKLMGNLTGYAAPQDYADIKLDFSRSGIVESDVSNYIRDLDLRTALATVSYDYDGVHYTREYFNSYPDNVLVIRMEADQDGMLTFDASMALKCRVEGITAENDTITARGYLSSNGQKNEAQLKVINEGGEIAANNNGSIAITGADAVTLILACGTDYKMELPTFRGEDPHEAVSKRVVDAAKKGYEAVKKDHVADHSKLFSRLELSFNEEIPQIPTDELILKYRNMVDGDGSNIPTEAEQRALEIICYQFGRYLTIAGSREGALPTNLQGVWGEGRFAWYGDYHFNINVQMNYWPTMASNLGECLLPFNEYLEVLRQAGRGSAASAFGIKSEEGEENGWLVGCFSTPYMFSALGQQNNAAGWNPIGSAWALLNAYEYFLYTEDVDYLREHIYPSMKEVANFWNEALWWSEAQQRYVSAPSYSPENGPIVNGASYDQQFIWQHFENTIQAAEILGVDEDLVETWREKQSKLDPVLVGDSGQVKEWYEETTFGKAQAGDLEEIDIPMWRASLGASVSGNEPPHRHISHLMALYPCTIINKDNAKFMDAAIVTLNERGLDATGWSKAHKLNLWARTGNAENSFAIVQSAVGGGNSGFLTNLFSSHGGGANYKQYPIFQIDGNFGYTAGVNEMLLQSQLGYTQFLPTVPEEWNNGSVKGIVARGNFVIDMAWRDGSADKFAITSRNGGEFIGEYENLSAYTVKDSKGAVVEVTKLSDDKISFDTEKGETYTINFNDSPEKLIHKIELAQAVSDSMTDERLASAKSILDQAIKAAQAIVDAENADQYYSGAGALGDARARAEAAISLLKKIGEAEAFHTESLKKADVWIAAQNVVDALSAEIRSATSLLSSAEADRNAFNVAAGSLESKMYAITELFNSVQLTASTTGGVLSMQASDEQFEIRYTLDGNTPSLISRLYEGPVSLPKADITIRAALFIGDVQMSKEFSFKWNGGNLALSASEVTASAGSSSASNAVDGNKSTTWGFGNDATKPATLTLTFAEPVTFDQAYVLGVNYYGYYYPKSVAVDYWDIDSEDWVELAAEPELYPDMEASFNFDEVTTTQVRLRVLDWQNYSYIAEFQISYSKAGELVDLTDLKELLTEADALRESAKYQNAAAADKEAFDTYYDLAAEVAANDTSDVETVTAATDALLDSMAALDGITPEKALEILREQLTAATTLADTLEGADLASTRNILEDVISAAWEVKTQAQTDKYYTSARALKNAIARTEQAIKLVDLLGEANEFLKEYTAKAGDWTAAKELLDALETEINTADAMLTNPTTAAKTLKRQSSKVSAAMPPVTKLFDSISLEISISDGKAVMTASDEQFEIRYTLDGNAPSLISKIYGEPVELPNRALTIKAAAFIGDKQFSNVVVKTLYGINLALNKTATSSAGNWGAGYLPAAAVDGILSTRWASRSTTPSLVVDLGQSYEISQVAVRQIDYPRISSFEIQVSADGEDESWTTAYVNGSAEANAVYAFDPVDARFVKLVVTAGTQEITINEFEVYAPPEAGESADMTALNAAIAAAETAKSDGTYEDANAEMKADFDYYLKVATEVAGNANSDAETVAAAVAALTGATEDLKRQPVTVNSGSGGGYYLPGETVTITADTAPAGKRFREWRVVSGDVTLESASSAETTFVMPAGAVEVTATYRNKSSASSTGGTTKPTEPEQPVETPFPFTDVAKTSWYYESVKGAWEKDLIDGVTSTLYKPDNTLTVAQAIKLAAALHQMNTAGKVTLTNATGGAWYSSYVDYAVEKGVIEAAYKNYTAAQMNAPATRAEFVHIFYGAMPKSSYTVKNTVGDNKIPDVKLTDKYGDEIYTFYRAGILTGSDTAGTFHAANSIKRSEVASILLRMYDATARQSITL